MRNLNIPSYLARMLQAQSDLTTHWFSGCPLSEKLPDHRSISQTLAGKDGLPVRRRLAGFAAMELDDEPGH